VKVLGERYNLDDEEDMTVKEVRRLFIFQVKNLFFLVFQVKTDELLILIGTLQDRSERSQCWKLGFDRRNRLIYSKISNNHFQ